QLDNCAQAQKLKGFGPFEMRPMFGGFGLFKNNLYFGIASQGSLFLRTDDSSRQEFIASGSSPLQGGFYTFSDTYEVPEAVKNDPAKLAAWAERAYRAAEKAAENCNAPV
ncbi:TfoX/Sxy family protein, partial [bacterium]|nr:TfoX/Sxy family protein [bacterium]